MFGCDLFWSDTQAIGTVPEDCTLTGGLVNYDVGRLVRAVLPLLNVLQIDAGTAQAFQLDATTFIVANCADVFGAEAEARAGNHGRRHLTAGRIRFAEKRDFTAIRGEMRDYQHGIGGVQSHADNVNRDRNHAGVRKCLLSFSPWLW